MEPPAPLQRQQLYDLVWTQPVHVVSALYGMSDVGLAKLCRRHRIPVPGRGYWQELRAGKRPRQARLPAIAGSNPEQVVLRAVARSDVALAEPKPRRPPIPPIPVPESLDDPHPEVAKAARTLRASKPDHTGILQARTQGRLDIRVSQGTLERALRIMDALLKAVEANGQRVAIGDSHPWATSIVVQDEEIDFSIDEKLTQVEHKPTPAEKLSALRSSWQSWSRYDHLPSGVLQMRIGNAQYLGVRTIWADGKRQRVEQCLADFVEGLQDVAEAKMVQRAEQEAARLRREEAQRLEAKRRAQRWLEERRGKELEAQAGRWQLAKRLREYVAAMREARVIILPTDLEVENLSEWIEWAEGHAERLDPLAVHDQGRPEDLL